MATTTSAEVIEAHPGVPYRLTADDFERMIETGIIPDDRRVGLWEGRLYESMAKKMPHAISSSKLVMALVRLVPDGWFLWAENPITISFDKVPLPDLAIVRGKPDDYKGRRPGGGDVALVIEVADTSLRKDTGPMLESYARAGIPVYWVVNLAARLVQVYQGPKILHGLGQYTQSESLGPGQVVPLVIDGRDVGRISVDDILPE
jgi:Uma2 family endonuclease